MPLEQFIPAVVEGAKIAADQFKEVLGSVEEILRTKEPLRTIAILALYGLMTRLSDKGERSPLYKTKGFAQSHVEFAQALALRVPLSDISDIPIGPAEITRLFGLLPRLTRSFAFQRMAKMGEECSDEQKGVFLVQEMLRSHTQFVRNWGFFDRVIVLLNVLYSPLDDEILQHVGLSASQLIAAFVHLIRQLESRFF